MGSQKVEQTTLTTICNQNARSGAIKSPLMIDRGRYVINTKHNWLIHVHELSFLNNKMQYQSCGKFVMLVVKYVHA